MRVDSLDYAVFPHGLVSFVSRFVTLLRFAILLCCGTADYNADRVRSCHRSRPYGRYRILLHANPTASAVQLIEYVQLPVEQDESRVAISRQLRRSLADID